MRKHPSYIGMYDGKLMEEQIRAFVRGLRLRARHRATTDFSTGAFTAQIGPLEKHQLHAPDACVAWGERGFTQLASR